MNRDIEGYYFYEIRFEGSFWLIVCEKSELDRRDSKWKVLGLG